MVDSHILPALDSCVVSSSHFKLKIYLYILPSEIVQLEIMTSISSFLRPSANKVDTLL